MANTKGLADRRKRTDFQRPGSQLRTWICDDQGYRRVRIDCSNGLKCLDSIQTWHYQADEDEVEPHA